ncbi:Unknown protein [Striga hermonthica]|uniref:GAG-pre-integrase domain-containing protein n=1 Tax=Striga hermonthica TaxID=68872 RepID=A0A9N7NHN8_STRHE|nr:Unknown protein [Striga hermonthica]
MTFGYPFLIPRRYWIWDFEWLIIRKLGYLFPVRRTIAAEQGMNGKIERLEEERRRPKEYDSIGFLCAAREQKRKEQKQVYTLIFFIPATALRSHRKTPIPGVFTVGSSPKLDSRENPTGKGKEKKAGDGEDGEKVATATDDFLIIYEGDVVNVACQETSWVIDSGASIHVTSRRDFFRSYTPGDFGSVRMGNDGIAKAVGMGDVHLETENGNTLVLRGVKHVPNIRMNLISTGKLDDEGFCNTFRDGKWKLTKGSLIVARGQKYSSLYVMNVKIVDPMINAVDDERTVELWHNRLSHMSEKGLTVLAKKNLLPGVKTAKVHTSENGADMMTKTLPKEKLESQENADSRSFHRWIVTKFGKQVHNFLLFVLNGGDWILSTFGLSVRSPSISSSCLCKLLTSGLAGLLHEAIEGEVPSSVEFQKVKKAYDAEATKAKAL